jgi:hypothetical protein
MAYPNQANTGLFLPTSFPVVIPDDIEELVIRLYQDIGFICSTVNLKESAYYPLQEFVTGQVYFPNPLLKSTTSSAPAYRPTYRKVIDFGALPNAATKSVAHGITLSSNFSFTRIYATASNQTALTYFPIPGNGVNITVDATNVNITTTVDLTAYTKVYVVLEFLNQ